MKLHAVVNSKTFKIVKAFDSGIAEIIELLWGHPECTQYMSQILYGDPAKHKQKKELPPEVALALIKIFNYHADQYPTHSKDVWQFASEQKKK